MNRLQLAGTLILIAGIQFILGVHIAESTYPGYSVNQNLISDLVQRLDSQKVASTQSFSSQLP